MLVNGYKLPHEIHPNLFFLYQVSAGGKRQPSVHQENTNDGQTQILEWRDTLQKVLGQFIASTIQDIVSVFLEPKLDLANR